MGHPAVPSAHRRIMGPHVGRRRTPKHKLLARRERNNAHPASLAGSIHPKPNIRKIRLRRSERDRRLPEIHGAFMPRPDAGRARDTSHAFFIDRSPERVARQEPFFAFAIGSPPFYSLRVALRFHLSILVLSALGVSAVSAATALAQPPPPGQSGTATDAKNPSLPAPEEDLDESDDESDEPHQGQPRPAAFDQRTMHLLIHGRVGAAFPAGSITSGLGTASASSAGIGFGGGIGLGLSRHLVLEMSGGFAKLGAEDGCDACSASSFDFGLGFSYHLAQGIALDPWISYGVGFRSATFTSHALRDWISNDTSATASSDVSTFTFRGLDFTRLALGGEFYPVPSLGFGPYFELDLGTTVARKDDLDAQIPRSDKTLEASVYAIVHVGLRITFDPVSKAPPRISSGVGSRKTALSASF